MMGSEMVVVAARRILIRSSWILEIPFVQNYYSLSVDLINLAVTLVLFLWLIGYIHSIAGVFHIPNVSSICTGTASQ